MGEGLPLSLVWGSQDTPHSVSFLTTPTGPQPLVLLSRGHQGTEDNSLPGSSHHACPRPPCSPSASVALGQPLPFLDTESLEDWTNDLSI